MTRALRLLGGDRVAMVEAPALVPEPGDAVVRIEATGLCGSERGMFAAGSSIDGPLNAGHEAVGIVETAPPGCGIEPGARVGISALRGCGECAACHDGHEMRCARGARPQLGLHAERTVVAASTLRLLPDGIDPAHGVLLTGDALGVAVRAHRRFPSPAGHIVLVIGLGPVGLGHVLVRARDADVTVLAVEPSAARRQLAEDLGARATMEPDRDLECAPDLIIESTGIPSCIARAMELVRPGGTVLQSGECERAEIRPSAHLIHREITYAGSWYYGGDDYPDILALARDGSPIDRMITHEFPAARAQEAVDTFLGGDGGKVVLRWDGEVS